MKDDNQPVTVAELRREIAPVATRAEMQEMGRSLREEIAGMEQRVGVQFEELRHDVLGGLRDIQSLLKDKAADHETRIDRLERFAGITA